MDGVITTIRTTYKAAAAHLSPDGSDIIGQYEQAAEWFRQLGGNYQLQLDLLTDGFQNIGIDLSAQVLDPQQAAALAQQTPMPDLSGANVTIAGLGRVTGATPTSAMVDGLVAYDSALCHRAHAARCVAVSDFQAAGW